jgi:hypothetical protein
MPYTWRDPGRPDGTSHTWPDLAAVASDWWTEEPPYSGGPSPAHDFVAHELQRGERLALDLIQTLIEAAPDTEHLVDLGPGPIEDLVSHFGHGAKFVDEIEARVRRDARWQAAIAELWVGDSVSLRVRLRLVALGAVDRSRA